MESALHDNIERWFAPLRRVHLNLIYLIGFALFLPFYIHQINGDTVSYIAVARRYAQGDLLNAVNGYWSPLICWFLIPFILLKIPELLAFKIISGVCGWIAINLMYHILQRVRMSAGSRLLTLLLIIPHLLLFIMRLNTPDILGFTIWLTVVLVMLKMWNKPNYRTRMLLGLLGALSYFARYYHFYIFLFSLLIFLILVIMKHKKLYRGIFSSAFVFFVITSVWMLLINFKYGQFTPTLAISYNISQTEYAKMYQPAQIGDSLTQVDYNDYLITSWEEPSNYEINEWSPFHTLSDFKTHAWRRFLAFKLIVHYYFIESLIILLAFVLLLFKQSHFNSTQWLLLILGFIYPSGYLLLITEPRYFIFPLFVFITLSIHILNNKNITEKWIKAIICLLFIVMLLIPLKRTIQYRYTGQRIYDAAQFFSSKVNLKDQAIVSSPGQFWNAMYLSYHVKAMFQDGLKPERIKTLLPELKARRAQYYFCLKKEMPPGFKIIGQFNDVVMIQLY